MKKHLFEINAITCTGNVRKNNEDNFFVNGYYLSPDRANSGTVYFKKTCDPFVAGICDGMGGARFGERAALIAASNFYNCIQRFENPLRSEGIIECVADVSRLVFEQLPNSGTTFAAVYAFNNRLTAVNVGDSRIYIFSNGKLKQVSKDHTLAQIQIDAGLLTRDQARESNLRYGLTQYLGMNSDEMIFAPNIYILNRIGPEDFILICSDGLTDFVDDGRIEKILSENVSLKNKTEMLIKAALNNNGQDNVTVMTIKIN